MIMMTVSLAEPLNQKVESATLQKNSNTKDISTIITGNLIYEVHGKITSQKTINQNTQEVSYAGIGRFTNGVNVSEEWTFINSHGPGGAIQGVGHGMLKTKDNKEIATSIGYGRGLVESGKTIYPTAQLYSTNSTGKINFLKNIVGFSEWQVDNAGNYFYKMWQFK